ncbi:MAG TPA: hypothetical protein PLM72_10845 [Spirochaetota bacterium]|nr:hypothetical protein [Spirochaetota bacterium]
MISSSNENVKLIAKLESQQKTKEIRKRLSKARKLLKKELAEIRLAISHRLRCEVTPFENDTPEKQQKRIARAKKDQNYFNTTYLPHYFTSKGCELHDTINEILKQIGIAAAVGAPRNFAKSTTIFGNIIKQAAFGERHYILMFSCIRELAEIFIEYMKIEFEMNERIIHDFGDLRSSEGWRNNRIILKTDCCIQAMGPNGRGFRYKNYRPDLIICDDLENDEQVQSKKRTKKLINWILEVVIPAMDDLGENGTFLIVGNVISKKSVLSQLLTGEDYTSWIRHKFAAIKKDGTALWNEKFPLEKLQRIALKIGQPAFQKEMMNNPGDGETDIPREWVKYYKKEDLNLAHYVVMNANDAAATDKESSNFKASITVGKNIIDGKLRVIEAYIKKVSPEEFAKYIYGVRAKYKPTKVGFETQGNQTIWTNFLNMCAQMWHKTTLPLLGLSNTTHKLSRIYNRVAPLMQLGILEFCKGDSDQDILVEQILALFDDDVDDDGPDALEMVLRMLDDVVGRFTWERVDETEKEPRKKRFIKKDLINKKRNGAW